MKLTPMSQGICAFRQKYCHATKKINCALSKFERKSIDLRSVRVIGRDICPPANEIPADTQKVLDTYIFGALLNFADSPLNWTKKGPNKR